MKFGTDQLDSKLKRFPPGGNSDFQFLLVWGLDIDLTRRCICGAKTRFLTKWHWEGVRPGYFPARNVGKTKSKISPFQNLKLINYSKSYKG